MENTNEQEIKIGDYVKLKSDPDQIFIIAEINTWIYYFCNWQK